jgi:hypothetical protein
VVSDRPLQYGVHLGHLSRGEEVLPQAEADRGHVGVSDGEPQPGDHVRGRSRRAGEDVGRHQDHPEGRGGGDLVHLLEVSDLLATRLPGRGRAGECGHNLDLRGGQPELAVVRL